MLKQKYVDAGILAYAFMNAPNERIHPLALLAAEAANCAGEQGKFWQVHQYLMNATLASDYRDVLRSGNLEQMNETVFEACITSGKYSEFVRKGRDSLKSHGVTATPTFLIGTREPGGTILAVRSVLQGAVPLSTFEAAIEELTIRYSSQPKRSSQPGTGESPQPRPKGE